MAVIKYVIEDWAGNRMFNEKSFKSVEDADDYLTQWIEKTYPDTKDNEERFAEEYNEFFIIMA